MSAPQHVTPTPTVAPAARRLVARLWFVLVAAMMALAWPAPVRSQGLESVLSPGPVIRGHAKVEAECAKCHVRFDRAAQDSLCVDCHKPVGQDMRARSGFHGRQKPQPCRSCHTEHKGRDARVVDFTPARFDHRQSDYELRGKHLQTDCVKCHAPGKAWREAPSDCNACHRKDDVHKGELGVRCQSCHGEANWKEARFDHDKDTRFALTGRHLKARCDSCHPNARYKEAPRTCIGCHRRDDEHKGSFGEKCESCHDDRAWKPSTFNHDTDTRYALRGKHRATKCGSCHTGPLYRSRTGTTCWDCHRKDDSHKESLGRECASCHTERDWKEAPRFDHDKTRFPLLGKHHKVDCKDCHKSERYKDAPKDCGSCHRKDDKHEGSLGEKCEACHTERDWKTTQGRFDHDKTKFPLRNAHAALKVKCSDCHKDARSYRPTPLECIACHRKDDKHQGSLGERCEACHGDRDWKTTQGRFDHDQTRFALRNAHAAPRVKCSDCHKDPRSYARTPLACEACHRKDDKHEGQLGPRCDSCHGDRDWKTTQFDHGRARFALVGRHIAVACRQCHATPRYRDAARECDGCHRKDDKHALRFGLRCESCHNARAWRIWDYDHARRARYALDGAHRKVACEACHSDSAPAGKPIAAVARACVGCHRKDDVHDNNFGPNCEQCHLTQAWPTLRGRIGRGVSRLGDEQDHWNAGLGALFGRASRLAQPSAGRIPS